MVIWINIFQTEKAIEMQLVRPLRYVIKYKVRKRLKVC